MALVALLCDGHVLIEDVPGVGKTMLARAAWARCPTCPCRQPSSDRSVGKHIGVQAVEARGKVKRVVLNILTGRQP